MDYNNPPESSKTVVSVNGVPLGTYDNLLCITGGEGTGKSNFVSALIAGTLADDTQNIDTLGFEVSPNYSDKAVLHYDTEQSEFQLFKESEQDNQTYRITCTTGFLSYVLSGPYVKKGAYQHDP